MEKYDVDELNFPWEKNCFVFLVWFTKNVNFLLYLCKSLYFIIAITETHFAICEVRSDNLNLDYYCFCFFHLNICFQLEQ